MTFERSTLPSLLFLLAVACSGGGGGATGASSGQDGSSSGGSSGSTSSGGAPGDVDAAGSGSSGSSGASSSGASADGAAVDGSGTDGPREGGSDADGGDGGSAAGGPSAVAAFCTAGCNRESDCAAQQDAAAVDVTSCKSTCESTNDGDAVVLYRADYMASLASCVASASCSDTLAGHATSSCSSAALAAITPDSAVVALCQTIESLSCLSAPTCLSTYKVLGDAAVQALSACVSTPNYCANVDAGAGCLTAALTPH